jgi:sortase A
MDKINEDQQNQDAGSKIRQEAPIEPAAVPPAELSNPKQGKKRRKPGMVIFDVLIVLLVVSGLYMVLRPVIIHYLQDRVTQELVKQFDQGDGTILIDPNALPLNGEDIDYYADMEGTETTVASNSSDPTETSSVPGETTAPSPTPAAAKVTVKAIGRVIIPTINVNMPVAEGIAKYTLRVAIGHYSRSAGFGQPGNCILLGHRMYNYGRHFNRLGEVAIGQQIILEDKKNRYIYEVDQIDTITPDKLIEELYKEVEGSRIMLVTCTPLRVASHRLLVKGSLILTEPLD